MPEVNLTDNQTKKKDQLNIKQMGKQVQWRVGFTGGEWQLALELKIADFPSSALLTSSSCSFKSSST